MSGRKALFSLFAGLILVAGIAACDGLDPGDYVVYRLAEEPQAARVSALAVPDYNASQAEKDAHPAAMPFKRYIVEEMVEPDLEVDLPPPPRDNGDGLSEEQLDHQYAVCKERVVEALAGLMARSGQIRNTR